MAELTVIIFVRRGAKRLRPRHLIDLVDTSAPNRDTARTADQQHSG